jgi:hypothetical protein
MPNNADCVSKNSNLASYSSGMRQILLFVCGTYGLPATTLPSRIITTNGHHAGLRHDTDYASAQLNAVINQCIELQRQMLMCQLDLTLEIRNETPGGMTRLVRNMSVKAGKK